LEVNVSCGKFELIKPSLSIIKLPLAIVAKELKKGIDEAIRSASQAIWPRRWSESRKNNLRKALFEQFLLSEQ
jgi:NAD dependent epimerase/dehydratase family enzyme